MAAETRVKKAVKSPLATKRKATEDVSPAATKKQKPGKVGAGVKAKKTDATPEKKTKKASKTKAVEEEAEVEGEDESGAGPEEDEEVDDETQALVRTIDSDVDEEDVPEEQDSGLQKGKAVPKIPKVSGKEKKALEAAAATGDGEPGTIYIGHIPRGFFEHEMRAYLGQYGEVTKVRLSRSRKTGNSRGYAFVEFANKDVAEIVAKTMNNYLLFNRVLRVKVVPASQIPPNLWVGANRRFKKVPWNKMAGRELAQPKSESTWQKKVDKEEQKRQARAEKLKELGYDYEGPKLKAPEAVQAVEGQEPPKAIEAPPATDEEEAEAAPAEEGEDAVEQPTKHVKKAKAKSGQEKKSTKSKKAQS